MPCFATTTLKTLFGVSSLAIQAGIIAGLRGNVARMNGIYIMTKFAISASYNHLAAAMQCTAQKCEIRYYLIGVLFDAQSKCFVGTNGNAMLVTKPGSAEIKDGAPRDFIMPLDFVENLLKLHKGFAFVDITVHEDGRIETEKLNSKEIDGKFPQWRRCYPRGVSGAAGQFSKDLLNIGTKANKYFVKKANAPFWPLFQDGATGSAVGVLGDNDAHIVIMPYREKNDKFSAFYVN